MSHLNRMYGFFQCTECKKKWESSHVYCRTGSVQAAYGQECKSCKVMCMPYLVQEIVCSVCGLAKCECDKSEKRHTNLDKHHRRDLCAKCRAGYWCTKQR